MVVYRLETIVPQNSELLIKALPFLPGEAIEVIILARSLPGDTLPHFPLQGTILKYEDPTEPVTEAEWDVLQ